MEGTCTGRYGFIVTTMYPKPEHISDGVVDPATGFAHYDIKFSAIICRPFKGEVIDAIVTTVNKMGFFAEAGPLQIFVSNKVIIIITSRVVFVSFLCRKLIEVFFVFRSNAVNASRYDV